jgi:hypothetical protein
METLPATTATEKVTTNPIAGDLEGEKRVKASISSAGKVKRGRMKQPTQL